MTASGCLIQDSRADADIVVEPRVGALGTDGHEVTYGIPQNNSIGSAASVLSGVPAIPVIPEISFGKNDELSGIAKIIVFAYDRETREPLWQSGIAKAESNSSSTWILGAGPFQKGTIYEGMRFAGKPIEEHEFSRALPAPRSFPGRRLRDFALNRATSEKATLAHQADEQTPEGPADFMATPVDFSHPFVFRQIPARNMNDIDDAIVDSIEGDEAAKDKEEDAVVIDGDTQGESKSAGSDAEPETDENVVQTGFEETSDK